MALVLLLLAAGVACASEPGGQSAGEPPAGYVECSEPRRQACTREYRPVCAQRDTGIRCVTTPCDSSEWVTAPNPCVACSDPSARPFQ